MLCCIYRYWAKKGKEEVKGYSTTLLLLEYTSCSSILPSFKVASILALLTLFFLNFTNYNAFEKGTYKLLFSR